MLQGIGHAGQAALVESDIPNECCTLQEIYDLHTVKSERNETALRTSSRLSVSAMVLVTYKSLNIMPIRKVYSLRCPYAPNSFSDRLQFSRRTLDQNSFATSMFRLAAQRGIANKFAGSSRGISCSASCSLHV